MRLLRRTDNGLDFAGPFSSDNVPPYAILSHMWGDDCNEVTFGELLTPQGKSKAGYSKIEFCGIQAEKDGIDFFWVDTCCIDKANFTELSEAITSMYKWYARAAKCYVYLSDVDFDATGSEWMPDFLKSRWFTRGWTLQELIAPVEVMFHSKQGRFLGSKITLAEQVHKVTMIPLAVLRGAPVSQYPLAERLGWAESRNTTKKEDRAYCLLGILDIYMPLMYGEGANAFRRLEGELEARLVPLNNQSQVSFTGVYSNNGVQPVKSYVCRPKLEQRLAEQLTPNELGEMRTVVIWGLGGTGKSQLTRDYIKHHERRYQAIFWIDASNKSTIERDFTRIFKQINQNVNTAVSSVDDAIFFVKTWLSRQRNRCLWVTDSADNVDDATDEGYINLSYYTPEALQLDRIITTRSSHLRRISSQEAIEVHEMEALEAVELLQRCSNLNPVGDVMLEVVRELGYLALAITMAGSYICEDPELRSDPSLYVMQLREQWSVLMQQKPHPIVHQYGETILSTWEVSYRRMQRQSPLAAHLLALLGFFDPDDIFLDLILTEPNCHFVEPSDSYRVPAYIELRKRLSEPVVKLQWINLACPPHGSIDRQSLREAFKVLGAFSFLYLREPRKAYSMHQLVHQWCKSRLDHAERDLWHKAALELVAQTASKALHDIDFGSRLIPHITGIVTPILRKNGSAIQIDRRDRQSLQMIAEFLAYHGRWDYEEDIRSFVRRDTNLILGSDHPIALDSLHDLAVVLSRRKKYSEAEELCQLELRIRSSTAGEQPWNTDPDTWRCILAAMDCWAGTLHGMGKFSEAEHLYKLVYHRKRARYRAAHILTLASAGNLARIYHSQSRYREAENLCYQTLSLRSKVLGEQHADTLTSMNDLAVLLSESGKSRQAVRLAEQTLATRKQVLGEQHPDTLTSMHTLAEMFCRSDSNATGLKLHREVMDLRMHVLGVDHPDTLTSVFCYGKTLFNRWVSVSHDLRQVVGYSQAKAQIQSEATELLLTTLGKRTKILGEEHPDTLTSLHGVARVLSGEEAKNTFLKALRLRQKVLGNNHLDTLKTMQELALIYMSLSKLREAESLLVTVYETRARILCEMHGDTWDTKFKIERIRKEMKAQASESDTDSEQGVAI